MDIGFSSISVHDVMKDSTQHETIISFNVDQRRFKLILILKKSSYDVNENHLHRFKIFDLITNTVEHDMDINFKPLIGRLLSGLYTFGYADA